MVTQCNVIEPMTHNNTNWTTKHTKLFHQLVLKTTNSGKSYSIHKHSVTVSSKYFILIKLSGKNCIYW